MHSRVARSFVMDIIFEGCRDRGYLEALYKRIVSKPFASSTNYECLVFELV